MIFLEKIKNKFNNLKNKILKYFSKEYFNHFKEKCMSPVPWFYAYRYWLGHTGIGLGIYAVFITLLQIIGISFIVSSWISTGLVIVYVLYEEIIVQAKGHWFSDPDFYDSLTDINQHLVVVPLSMFASGMFIIGLIFLILQIVFFYTTVDWTHQ